MNTRPIPRKPKKPKITPEIKKVKDEVDFSDHVWARQRSREELHPVGTNPRRYETDLSDASVTSYQLEEGLKYVRSRQLMLDIANMPWSFYKDAVNYKHSLLLHGSHTVGVDTYREDLYTRFYKYAPTSGVPVSWTDIPTRHLLAGIDAVVDSRYSSQVSSAVRLPDIMAHWDMKRYAEQGLKDIKISLNTGFNLLLFLGQYKDALRVFARYFSKAGWLDQLHAFSNKQGKLTLGSTARGIANTHLETQFGTLDFLRDMKTLLETLWSWKQRSDLLERMAKQKHSFHNGAVLIPLSPHIQEYPIALEGLVGTKVRVETDFGTGIQYHSCIEYSYSVPAVQGFLKRLLQLSDSLGIHVGSAVWELVPWTFVADWFTNIGEWIQEQETDWFECIVTVSDYCLSGRLVATRLVSLDYQNNPGCLVGDEIYQRVDISSATTTYYKREVDSPPALSSNNLLIVRTEPWRVKRLAIATSLVVQRIPSRERVIEAAWKSARKDVIAIRRLILAARRRLIAIDRNNKRKQKHDIFVMKQRIKDARGLERAKLRVQLAKLYGGRAVDYKTDRGAISSKRSKNLTKLPRAISRLNMIQRQQSAIEHIMSKI